MKLSEENTTPARFEAVIDDDKVKATSVREFTIVPMSGSKGPENDENGNEKDESIKDDSTKDGENKDIQKAINKAMDERFSEGARLLNELAENETVNDDDDE